MDSPETNPVTALLGLLMMLQLALAVALLLGGIYVLYCLQRAAAGLDRLASVAEAWLAAQTPPQPPILPPGSGPLPAPMPSAPPREWTPGVPPPMTVPGSSES